MRLSAAFTLAALTLRALSSRFQRIAVVGNSMAPQLLPGDRLLVWKPRRSGSLRPGDVVVAPDPREPERALVKRLAAIDGSLAWLAGDNPDRSTDSRDFGPIPLSSVVGRAVYRYAPATRAGRLDHGRSPTVPSSTGRPPAGSAIGRSEA